MIEGRGSALLETLWRPSRSRKPHRIPALTHTLGQTKASGALAGWSCRGRSVKLQTRLRTADTTDTVQEELGPLVLAAIDAGVGAGEVLWTLPCSKK